MKVEKCFVHVQSNCNDWICMCIVIYIDHSIRDLQWTCTCSTVSSQTSIKTTRNITWRWRHMCLIVRIHVMALRHCIMEYCILYCCEECAVQATLLYMYMYMCTLLHVTIDDLCVTVGANYACTPGTIFQVYIYLLPIHLHTRVHLLLPLFHTFILSFLHYLWTLCSYHQEDSMAFGNPTMWVSSQTALVYTLHVYSVSHSPHTFCAPCAHCMYSHVYVCKCSSKLSLLVL